MKIELKKITFSERMSEETNAFVADLYVNGKKVGYVKNDGRGGCTEYNGYNVQDNETIKQAEAYCKSLPKVRVEEFDFEYEPTLESVIDEQFENWLKEKELKKMNKLFQKAIVVGKPNSLTYKYINFKQPLTNVSKTVLEKYVAKLLKDDCTNGEVILNTNFKYENEQVIFI